MDLCWQSNVSAFQYAVLVGHNFLSKEQVSLENKNLKLFKQLNSFKQLISDDSIIFIYYL